MFGRDSMFRLFTPKKDKFKVVCQKCGRIGEVNLNKMENNDFSDGFYYFSEKSDKGIFEWFLCSDCYSEIYLEHDEL
ncbi:MAG TPA: hypothetical protein EYP30_04665 [Archaeoglobaceae archaeon]|nr:hypothetical protein [Archaeoglobaceae archaeon]